MSAGIRGQFMDADIEKSLGQSTDTLLNNNANTEANSGSPKTGIADTHDGIVENICATCAKNLSLEIVDEKSKIEEVFHRRKTLLERSCSYINQLNTANRIASINQLKEIHLLLHDLDASHESIAKRLESYGETKISLDKTQENFMILKLFDHRQLLRGPIAERYCGRTYLSIKLTVCYNRRSGRSFQFDLLYATKIWDNKLATRCRCS